MKQKFFIDSHKGATFFFVFILITYFGQWRNYTALAYLALHGTYGFLWILKSRFFPDEAWERPTGLPFGLCIWGSLCAYWIAPWLITSRGIEAPAWYIGLFTIVYVLGVFFHFASDMQKHISLALRPGELIQDGLWAGCRNPNYFGELLIYLGFSALAMHWLPLAALAAFVLGYWVPRMIEKDRVLARLPGFEEYRKRSKMFIPFVV